MAQVMAMPGTEEKASSALAIGKCRPARRREVETLPFHSWLQGLAGCGREEAVGARGRQDGLLRGSRGECDAEGPESLSVSRIAWREETAAGDDSDAGAVLEMGHGAPARLAHALAAPRDTLMTAAGGDRPAGSPWNAGRRPAEVPGFPVRGAGDADPVQGPPVSPVDDRGTTRLVTAEVIVTAAPAGSESEASAAAEVRDAAPSPAELAAGEVSAESEGERTTRPGTHLATLPDMNGHAARPTAQERAAAGAPRDRAALEPEATANATGREAAGEDRACSTAAGGGERPHARHGIAAGHERATRPSAADVVSGLRAKTDAREDPGFHARLSGTEARETYAGRAEARMLELRDRVVAAARTVSRGETVRAQLKLVPESLGKLELEVEWNGGVTVRLTAHTGAAFEAMQRELPQLRAALLAAGLDLDGLHLGMEGGSARGETAARRGSAGARRVAAGAEAAVSAVRPAHDGILDIEA